MPDNAITIVDANSFYCSCFAAFDASLARRPVIVLSNNDGNVIARNSAAKRLGIGMGAPFFHIRDLVAQADVAVFSSNYGFFAEMSWRFQSLLYQYSPRVEHYSIDEAWLNIEPTARHTREAIGREIHQRVCALSGIPVAVELAETKTLAKLALELAKTSAKTRGVLDLTRSPWQEQALDRLPVADVWGIGPRYTQLLNKHGIITALDLREADDSWIRQHLTIVGLRTAHELRGIVCYPINPAPPVRKLVSVSRSFGTATESLAELRAAIAHFTAIAAEKLRRESLLAGKLTVWLDTDRFRDVAQYANSLTLTVAPLSQCTLELTHLALRGAERFYRVGFAIKKAGVVLSELETEATAPRRLWQDDEHRQELMRVMDALNARWGRGAVRVGLHPSENLWRTKAQFAAPGYTTKWAEIMRCQ